MGAVYEACDQRLDDAACAVKEMLDQHLGTQDEATIERKFREEKALLARLRHPGIPGVRDYFREGGLSYIVMDYIHGSNLEQELEDTLGLTEQPLSAEKVVDVALEVLDVLVYLHEQACPVIHRDVKPANLIREHATGSVKLVDFGLARKFDAGAGQTTVGTLGYCPMEQMQGRAEPRSDLYALGVTMHHLLTGIQPRPLQLDPLDQLLPELDGRLSGYIHRASATRLEDRFPSARAMRDALQKWKNARGNPEVLRALPAQAEPTTTFAAEPTVIIQTVPSHSYRWALLIPMVLYVGYLLGSPGQPSATATPRAVPTSSPKPAAEPVAVVQHRPEQKPEKVKVQPSPKKTVQPGPPPPPVSRVTAPVKAPALPEKNYPKAPPPAVRKPKDLPANPVAPPPQPSHQPPPAAIRPEPRPGQPERFVDAQIGVSFRVPPGFTSGGHSSGAHVWFRQSQKVREELRLSVARVSGEPGEALSQMDQGPPPGSGITRQERIQLALRGRPQSRVYHWEREGTEALAVRVVRPGGWPGGHEQTHLVYTVEGSTLARRTALTGAKRFLETVEFTAHQ